MGLLLLVFLKIDYRFIESFTCCQDDHDYFMHAETIALDFDLDYTNQLAGYEEKRFSSNGKIAPKGFIGTGIFSSIFLYVGNLFEINDLKDNIFNYKILFYSLSSVVYLFWGIFLFNTIIKDLKLKIHPMTVLILTSATGLIYYSFERYSMTHVYEFFSTTLVIYFSHKFYKTNKNIYAFLVPIAIALAFSVRWVNYFILFLPYITYSLFKTSYKKESLMKNNLFLVSSIFSFISFVYLNYSIYGSATLNPQFVYGTEKMASGYFANNNGLTAFLSENISNLFKIVITQEFGILYFSPLIFFASSYALFLIFSKKINTSTKIFLLISFIFVYGPVLLWKSTASSYGFRYLLSSVSLCLIIFMHYKKYNENKFVNYYLIIISLFSLLSILFFETTLGTQLSLTEVSNSFDRQLRFSQPLYLSGLLESFFNLESYLKIFTTSFFGVFILKIVLTLFNIEELNSFLGNLGLPVSNSDFQELLINLENISILKIFIVVVLIYLLVGYFYKNIKDYEKI